VKRATFDVPTMYGDHHVIEVKRILLATPGIKEVYASSAFQQVEVTYDSDEINDLEIAMKLDEAGYLGEWTFPKETGEASYNKENTPAYFRHTSVYETLQQGVSFSQNVSYSGRPLWNCPGMGVVNVNEVMKKMEE
jgi:copper chaperone CopZ